MNLSQNGDLSTPMRVLHTSDWHLGNSWKGRSRDAEFHALFDWTIQTLKDEQINLLVIAGDIFDTSTPAPKTQKSYFDFLLRACEICPHIVIVSGNHDSPILLDAPGKLLESKGVHVIGVAAEPEKELIVLNDQNGNPAMLVGAVPFLRESDVRRSTEAGESIESKEQKTIQGIRTHYKQLCEYAETVRAGKDIPLIVTGHLFIQGCVTSDSVRDIHVGTIGQLGTDIFPDNIDYVALGHLHRPQWVEKIEHIQYSGAPLLMSFDEAGQTRSVNILQFDRRKPSIETRPIPAFVDVVRISGGIEKIEQQINALAETEKETLVEVIYTGKEYLADLNEQIEQYRKKLPKNVAILSIRNEQIMEQARVGTQIGIQLEDLTPLDLFQMRLNDHKRQHGELIDPTEQELLTAYGQILESVQNQDEP